MTLEEYTCQKGLLIVNWTQSHTQSLAASVYRGLSCMLHFWEKPHTGCQDPCTVLLLSESTLRREFLGL